MSNQDTVIAPGEIIARPFLGNLRDYSGCATMDEVQDLSRQAKTHSAGVLPLGYYQFIKTPNQISRGSMLYLGRYRTGAPMEYNGTLLIAPQNSGKTQLIIRWAQAANQAGYNVLIIDVKGNLYPKLNQQAWRGDVYHFSTDPDTPSDRINFLAGLDGLDVKSSKVLKQIVHAILPQEGWEQGEQLYFYQNRVIWLHALIQILKLYQAYYPKLFTDAETGQHYSGDLSLVYDLASDEQLLYRWLQQMRETEVTLRANQTHLPFGGVEYWINKLAPLINPTISGGQRRGEYTYRDLTQSIVTALEPFSLYGALYPKICEHGRTGRLFALDELNKGNSSNPKTLIFAAREQDLDDAVTVVSIVVKRMQQLLFERMPLTNPQPILLLLDETRRIRSFEAARYITFAREAKAGCVLVYQSIEQISEDSEINELLENIGTQIYLGSLVGATAKRFIDILPKRYRPCFSQNSSFSGSEAPSSSWELRHELVDYFTSNELYRLPAGNWPALVYIKDHPSGKPFLVEMDEAQLQQDEQGVSHEER